jgi:hypothetical protein
MSAILLASSRAVSHSYTSTNPHLARPLDTVAIYEVGVLLGIRTALNEH